MTIEILPPPAHERWPSCCRLIVIDGGEKMGDHGTWCRASGRVVWDWGCKINYAKDEAALKAIFDD